MYDKVCLIIGANSEIAAAIIERFVDSCRLILCWHNNNNRIKEYFLRDNVDQYCEDLRHEKQCDCLIKKLYQKYSHIDIVINCIGKNNRSAEITEDIWDDIIETNLKPAFFISKYYWKYFFVSNEEKHTGCMIHISSTAGICPIPASPHYIAAKAGVIALSDYFAKIMAPYVRVNTIAPGFVATSGHDPDKYHDLIQKIPMKRMADIKEIAQTVEYIVNCEYLTAQTFVIDGGMIS